MLRFEQSKEYSKELIALFILLIVMLGAAYWVSNKDYQIKIGSLIPFNYTSVATSLPEGNGWEDRSAYWTYSKSDSYYYLHANFRGHGGASAGIEWRYLLESKTFDSVNTFKQKAKSLESTILDTGTIQADGIVFRWVNMQNVPKQLYFYYALGKTADGRTIELDVWSRRGNRFSEELFSTVAPSFKVMENDLLTNGKQIVLDTKKREIPELSRRDRRDYFLRKKGGEVIGLSSQKLSLITSKEQSIYSIDSFSHIDQGAAWRNINVNFNSNVNLNTYAIRYNLQSSNPQQNEGVAMLCDRGVFLKVLKQGGAESKYFSLSEAAFPEPMQELLFKEFLSSNIKSCMIDLIMPSGFIFPVVLEKAKAQAGTRNIYLHYIHDADAVERIFFDKRGNVVRKDLSAQDLFVFRSSKRELLKYYETFTEILDQVTQEN